MLLEVGGCGWWWKHMFLANGNSINFFCSQPSNTYLHFPGILSIQHVYIWSFFVLQFCLESELRGKQSQDPAFREVTF